MSARGFQNEDSADRRSKQEPIHPASPPKNPQSKIHNHQSTLQVADEPLEYGRSPAFRRKIVEIYDHQCAACGLRIKRPAGNGVSFIDAAHLTPFSESHNDHPANGSSSRHNRRRRRADHHWRVSKILDPRCSNGEKELIELSGKSLLLPEGPAFHPDS